MVGFYLKKFRAEKTNGKYSEVVFQKGLNVISGPSSTGKSFIFQCINYLLGSSKKPKDIPQAKKYEYLYLEIETYNGDIYTIRRKRGDNDVTVIKGDADFAMKAITEGVTLSSKKLKKGSKDEDLTSFLLRLSGLSKQMQLSTNVRNSKGELSFRDIAKVILLDELDIQAENSPLTSGDQMKLTREQSVFKMLLTGEDDSDLIEIPDPQIARNKIKSKLEQIESTLARLSSKKEDFERRKIITPDSLTFEKVIEQLAELEKQIEQYTIDRSQLLVEKNKLSNSINGDTQLLSRFKILEEQYLIDIERITFILTGTEQVDNIDIGKCNCVLCGAELNKEKGLKINNDEYLASLGFEKMKITGSLDDLRSTISDLHKSVDKNTTRIHQVEAQIEKIETKIRHDLDPVKNSLSGKVKDLVLTERLLSKDEQICIEIKENENEKAILKQELAQVLKEGSRPEPNRKPILEFEERIQSLLREWQFINSTATVSFDYSNLDLSINGSGRAIDGKGKRSLIAAAYLIAFMIYCVEKELPHPGFVMIDSPLTPYRDSDEVSENDRLSDKVHKSFYENLSKLPQNMQLIVIENKDPSIGVTENIHYEHFTNKKGEGRQGFIIEEENE